MKPEKFLPIKRKTKQNKMKKIKVAIDILRGGGEFVVNVPHNKQS